nr:SBBP repeat-containing protein [Chitinophagaceae bacterium]
MKKLSFLISIFLFAFASTTAQNKQASTALQKNDNQFFIENKGQWDAEILYMANFGGLNAFITKKGIVYDFYELKEVKDSKKEIRSAIPNSSNEPEPPEMEKYGHMIRMNLLGCNEKAEAVGKEKSKTYYNYLIAGDTAHSRGYVGLYKEAVLKSVYEDIDMRYYFEGNSLRYDYILKPGADVRKINMQLEGSEHSYINSDGEWIFTTRFGEVKNTKLLSYQIIDGEQKEIPSKFKKDAKGNIVFELGAYDATKELVIDPLVYSTLIGGGQTYSYCTGLTLGDSNCVYVTGYVAPTGNFPITPGAYVYIVGFGSGDLSVISKFSADGSTLLFSTIFRSGNHSRAYDITLGPDKSINVVGYNYSLSGDMGCYLRLTPDGSSFVYANEYLDFNPYVTRIKSIKLDKNMGIYFTGSSAWAFPPSLFPPFPPISDSFFWDVDNPIGPQVFVAKFDSNYAPVFNSGFGRQGSSGTDIEVDSLGNVYVVGNISMGFPDYPYPSSFDSTFNGVVDAFLAKYSQDGTLLNLTYLGGSGEDRATSIQIDKQGNIFILGNTNSVDFPTTINCLNNSNSGGKDIFISKFDPTGTNLLYSTYFGGGGNELSTEIQIDSLGNIFFSGFTDSTNLPTSIGCYDSTYNGLGDAFVAKLTAAGDSILYSTYLGGSGIELSSTAIVASVPIGGMALDKFGDVYVGGSTLSGNSFPTTLGSYSQTPYGNYDIFVSKLKLTPCPVVLTTATSNAPLCVGGTLNLSSNMTGGVMPYTYHWYGPNGFISVLQNPIINNVSMVDSGLFSVMIVDAAGCNSSSSTNVIVKVCSGIQENTVNHTILIFPNPNNGTFTLQTTKLGNYELIDVAGRIIHTYEVKSSPYTITEKLSSGMYFIREKAGGIPNKFGPTQKIMIE